MQLIVLHEILNMTHGNLMQALQVVLDKVMVVCASAQAPDNSRRLSSAGSRQLNQLNESGDCTPTASYNTTFLLDPDTDAEDLLQRLQVWIVILLVLELCMSKRRI
jgi:hypothetical protein